MWQSKVGMQLTLTIWDRLNEFQAAPTWSSVGPCKESRLNCTIKSHMSQDIHVNTDTNYWSKLIVFSSFRIIVSADATVAHAQHSPLAHGELGVFSRGCGMLQIWHKINTWCDCILIPYHLVFTHSGDTESPQPRDGNVCVDSVLHPSGSSLIHCISGCDVCGTSGMPQGLRGRIKLGRSSRAG